MSQEFYSPLAGELRTFVQFKRGLGYRYERAEYRVRGFDRFLVSFARNNPDWQLNRAVVAWLSSKPGRKPISVSRDAAVLREYFKYLRRLPHLDVVEPNWPSLPTKSDFLPHHLTEADILKLLDLCTALRGPAFRSTLYRALILILYCTGIRFGEALRLHMRDVDTRKAVLFIEEFKGRARWVPFHTTLARELAQYLRERVKYAPASPDTPFFVGINGRQLPLRTANDTFHRLFGKAGLKPKKGRIGPRPYDLRHAFAVHRLTRWYRDGVDLHARLAWLAAYMGHVNIAGTETYLNATPELMALVAKRFHRRYRNALAQEERNQ